MAEAGPAAYRVPADGEVADQPHTAGIHPDRLIAGAAPARGLVLRGLLTGSRPAGAGWEADIQCAGGVVTARLPERPVTDGGELTVTAIDAPVFGPDGTAWPAAAVPVTGAAGSAGR